MTSNPNYTLRIPHDLREKLQQIADADNRSLAYIIIEILRKGVKEHFGE